LSFLPLSAVKSACSEEHPLVKSLEMVETFDMYLRRIRKKIRGEAYDYWALVESIRR